MINRITPENITELKPNQVFVFGSNQLGRHKSGAAKFALEKCGATLGQARGLQGQSYAIVTKKNWWQERSSTLDEIYREVLEFNIFAVEHPDLFFLVTKIGCKLAGYSIEEIAPLFKDSKYIKNISLPAEFWDILIEPLGHEPPTKSDIDWAMRIINDKNANKDKK